MNRSSPHVQLMRCVPWVHYLVRPAKCDGIRWNHMPVRALYGESATGVDAYRCKVVAHWRFTALKRSHGRSGRYCWQHLRCELSKLGEETRMRRWLERHQEIVAMIFNE